VTLLAEHADLLAKLRKAESAARKIHERSDAISEVRRLLGDATRDVRDRIAHYRREAA
jgi:hypothetical protein